MQFGAIPVAECAKFMKNVKTQKSLYRSQFSMEKREIDRKFV